MLPDLLKNNLLADPALTLVKSVDNIDEIWKRLKQAYGSSKLLLHKKLANGDGLDRVLKLLGEGRVTRWLSKLYDDENDDNAYTNEKSWLNLINFLEKELKVIQQKTLLFNNLFEKESSPK